MRGMSELPSPHAAAPSPASEPVLEPPRPAGLWRRFGAFIHELLFLVAYLFIIGLIFASVSGESMSAGKPQVLSGPIAWLQRIYLFVSIGAYFIYFWIKGRRTLAFKTWHLRLLSADGGVVSLKQAVTRYFAAWIGPALGLGIYVSIDAMGVGTKPGLGLLWLVALFTNFLWALIDPARQFLHDRVAGTRVIHSV